MKKRVSLLVAVLTFFAFAGISMAATVDVTVTAPNVDKSTATQARCDQAGNITLEWDGATNFTVGDQITVSLVGTPTFCKSFDMLVAVGDTNADASGFTGHYTIPTLDTFPVRQVNGTTGTLSGSAAGVAFKVQTTAGSSTALITVVSDTDSDGTFGLEQTAGNYDVVTFNAGTDVTTQFQLKLFNEKAYTPAQNNSAIYKMNSTSSLGYNASVIRSDNTLCVEVPSTYASDYVGSSFDAKDNLGVKLWDFNPATPNIAVISAGQTVSLYDCQKSEPGTIMVCDVDTSGTQQASNASTQLLLINEAGIGEPSGAAGAVDSSHSDTSGYAKGTAGGLETYLAGTHRNNNMVFQTSNGSPFTNGSYKLELEIKVAPNGSSGSEDALSGDYGAYFNVFSIATEGFSSAASVDYNNVATSACAQGVGDTTAMNGGATITAYDASDVVVTSAVTNPTASQCLFDSTATRAVKLVIDEQTLANFNVDYLTDNYMTVDIPDILINKDRLTAGMQVYVFAKWIKMPCELVGEGVLHVGTVYDPSGVTSTGTASSIIFPYFAEVAANGQSSVFWNGFTIANTSTTATANGTATLMIYEADGDVFTATIDELVPGSVYASLMSMLTPTLVTQGTNGDGIYGGQRCWVAASCDFTAAGTAQITHQNAGGVHSYLAIDNPTWGGQQVHD